MNILVLDLSRSELLMFFISSVSVRASNADVYKMQSEKHIILIKCYAHRFVKEKDWRILEQYTSNRKTLLLSARNHKPALTNGRFIPVGKSRDGIMDARAFRHLDNFIIRRVQAPIPYIMHNIGMEQWCVLGHDPDIPPYALKLRLVNVLVIDEDAA